MNHSTEKELKRIELKEKIYEAKIKNNFWLVNKLRNQLNQLN